MPPVAPLQHRLDAFVHRGLSSLLHQHLGLKEVRIQAKEAMDRPKEVGKAGDLAGYAMALTIRGTAPKEDKEEEQRDTRLRLLSLMDMAKVE